MIINTGCRTDIPAFYSKWLINRIREGYVLVRNPYYPNQVTKYNLSPEVVDCLAFCTKNPEPMLKYMETYNSRILKAKETIKNADAIIIGAGAGLSTAAGLEYSGKNFEENFKEFIKKYDFQDLYSASFYPFDTQEEKWAFWAKLVKLNRLNEPLELYKKLLDIVKK